MHGGRPTMAPTPVVILRYSEGSREQERLLPPEILRSTSVRLLPFSVTSRREAEVVQERFGQLGREFFEGVVRQGLRKNRLPPQRPPHGGERVAEGHLRLGVPRVGPGPGRLASAAGPGLAVEQQAHDREQPQQARGRPQHALLRAVPRRRQPQVLLRLLERHLDAPPGGVQGDDPRRAEGRVGAVEVAVLVRPVQVVHEHPTHRHQPLGRLVPVAGGGDELHPPLLPAVPPDRRPLPLALPGRRHHVLVPRTRRRPSCPFFRGGGSSHRWARGCSRLTSVSRRRCLWQNRARAWLAYPPSPSRTNRRSGNQCSIAATSLIAIVIGVRCRRPSFSSRSFGRYSATSTGSAHARLANGNFTLTASTTHRCPQSHTLWVRVERQVSRWRPLPYTCLPRCCAAVSSTASTTGLPSGTSSTAIAASTLPSGQGDQRARERTRW